MHFLDAERWQPPALAAAFTSLGVEEKQLLYAVASAVLAVLVDWLRRKLAQ